MNSTEEFLLDSFKENPIGNTDHFTWFITDIGVVALFKGAENYKIYNSNFEIDKKISLVHNQIRKNTILKLTTK